MAEADMQAVIISVGAMFLACCAAWNSRPRIVEQFPEPPQAWGSFALVGGQLIGILLSTSERRAELAGPIGVAMAAGVLYSLHVLASRAPRVALLAGVLGWIGFFSIALVLSIVAAFAAR